MNNLNEIRRIPAPAPSTMAALIGSIRPISLVLLALCICSAAYGEIPEPDTIFYGKIINRTSGQIYQLTQGGLFWVIRRPDGTQITVTNQITPVGGGIYSYSLRVPHEALAYGLTVSSTAVPLSLLSANCSLVQITVNGAAARIMAPGSSTFAVSQATRGSTYRLDLELFNPLADSAGDGIPDWWKAEYGIVDPNADPDGDGWSNLQEFLYGGNPTNDNRIPTLTTTESFVYANGTTGIRLQAVDSDSAPTNLFYTLLTAPQAGTLYLRNASPTPANSDAPLVPGSGFTQDDVNKGRLIFVHQSSDTTITADSFQVSLHDQTPSHPSSTNAIALNIYLPSYAAATMQQAQSNAGSISTLQGNSISNISGLGFYEQQMLFNYFLSRDHNYVIWDGSRAAAAQEIKMPSSGLTVSQYSQYVASYGHDRPQVLMAGAGADHLVGGMESDILIAGHGADSLRGNGGADLFVIQDTGSSSNNIEDFTLNDHDVIDISRVLTGSSIWLTNYVQITGSGSNSWLNINFNADGNGYNNMIVTLQGVQFSQNDLRSLVENGNLIVGNKALPPRLTIIASRPAASQNGPVAGQFTVTRTGPTDSGLTANVQVTGSAINGSDYQYIASQITFSPGQRTTTLSVNPYTTATVITQVVQVAIVSGAGYEVGSPSLAQVSIEPTMPQITIQAIAPIASKLDQSTGVFLVSRGGSVNNSVLVRLTVGGTAPASHYNSVSPFINFSPQQTTALIYITPKPTAILSNGLETVWFSIKPDSSYRIMTPSSDVIALVDQILTLGIWQQKYFATNNDDLQTFANEDPGNTGVRNLYRYGFGLNPLNPQLSTSRFPAYQFQNDHLSVSFKRPPAISDLNYIVEVSDDLLNWRSTTNDLEQYLPPSASSNDLETVFFRSKAAISTTPKLFMRVRLQLQ